MSTQHNLADTVSTGVYLERGCDLRLSCRVRLPEDPAHARHRTRRRGMTHTLRRHLPYWLLSAGFLL